MRAIGTLSNENIAERFSLYLANQGIANKWEGLFDASTGLMSYQIWIHDEDKINEASVLLKEFEKNPSDLKFETPRPSSPQEEEPREEPRRFKHTLTIFLMGLCIFLFFINTLQEIPLAKEKETLTPLEKELIYDEVSWEGVYQWVVLKIKKEPVPEVPLFTSLQQGEVWRLVTPIFLHGGLLHILFNMLWLWVLGRPVEERIGPFRTLLLTLIVACLSNTAQYLMSGPFFMGYSGVVCGLAGFIWMRERLAPWEGYPLNKTTVLFLLVFIGAIFVLQVVAFCLKIFTSLDFAPNIANTAHVAGAIFGALLARFPFFAQRVLK